MDYKITEGMIYVTIKVLGKGCSNCKRLEQNAKQAVKELGIDASVEKVSEMKDIISYGVMRTPALVIDENVKIMGRAASVEDIKKLIK